jgi:hypothetical protein
MDMGVASDRFLVWRIRNTLHNSAVILSGVWLVN